MFRTKTFPHNFCEHCCNEYVFQKYGRQNLDEMCEACAERRATQQNKILSLQKICLIVLVSNNLVLPYKDKIPTGFLEIIKDEMMCELINFFPHNTRFGLSDLLLMDDVFKLYELVKDIMPNGTYFTTCKYQSTITRILHQFDRCSYCSERKKLLNKQLIDFKFSTYEVKEFLCSGQVHKNVKIQWRSNFFQYGWTFSGQQFRFIANSPYITSGYCIYSPFANEQADDRSYPHFSSTLLIFPVISDSAFAHCVANYYSHSFTSALVPHPFDDIIPEGVGLERAIMFHRENQVWPFCHYIFDEKTFQIKY